MRKTVLSRAAGIIMSAVLLLPLSGCTKSENNSEGQKDGNIEGLVYKGDEYSMADELNGSELSGGIYVKDRLYFISQKSAISDGAGETGGAEYSLVSMKKDGSDYTSVPIASGNVMLSSLAADSDGNIYYAEAVLNSGDTAQTADVTYQIKKVSPDGNALSTKDISAVVKEQEQPEKHDEPFIPKYVCFDKDSNIYLVGNFNTIVLDKNLGLLFSVATDYVENAVTLADKTVCLYQYSGNDSGKSIFCPIDTASKALGSPIEFCKTQMDYYNLVPVSGFSDSSKYDFYIKGAEKLYGYDIETTEKTEILDWIDSNISVSEITDIVYADENEIICTGSSALSKNPIITILHTADTSSLPEKTEITIAGLAYSMSDSLKNQVVMFNKKSEKYKVRLKTYDNETGYTDLNNDIMSGKIPDILVANNGMPFESYAAKGLFADLYSFMDNDPEIKRSDFLENILTAFETDGKLYRFADSFQIYTVLGKTAEVGEKTGWTYKDICDYADSKPDGTEIFPATTKNDILTYGMKMSSERFIDYEKRTCNFKSEEFIELLKFANRFLSTMDYEGYFDEEFWDNSRTMYKDGKALLQVAFLASYRDLYAFEKLNFSEPVTAKGFPCYENAGNAIVANTGLAISAKSKNQDGAWEFIRTLLSDDYQESVENFPVKKSALEAKASQAMVKDETGDSYIMSMVGSVGVGLTIPENMGSPAQADIDKVNELISSLDSVMKNDSSVMDIINEEAGAYFDGSKTPEEAADLIQNRVQLYLNENS